MHPGLPSILGAGLSLGAQPLWVQSDARMVVAMLTKGKCSSCCAICKLQACASFMRALAAKEEAFAGAGIAATTDMWRSHVGKQSKRESLKEVVLPLLASTPALSRLAADFQERLTSIG